ncbi:MAG: SCF ubiquitin ligase complex subunit cdc4 [Piccolia ochrophora]|nr:MAG: SCF ubiquitin ligase complex subunit cdc4 [Piccolia ochrophora]
MASMPVEARPEPATSRNDIDRVPQNGSLGQFSYAPATQTTVVTTTTTTTTSFPPLVLKPPRHLNDLDPKQYPLASSPTPPALKRLCFDLDGTPTCFREAEDASRSFEELKRQRASLDASSGLLRTVTQYEPRFETPEPRPTRLRLSSNFSSGAAPPSSSTRTRKHPTSPVSISKAAELARLQRGTCKRQNVPNQRSGSPGSGEDGLPKSRTSASLGTTTPATPDMNEHSAFSHQQRRLRPLRRRHHQLANVHTSPLSPGNDLQDTPSTLSPETVPSKSVSFAGEEELLGSLCHSASDQLGDLANAESPTVPSGSIAAATPPITDTDLQLNDDIRNDDAHSTRPIPPHIDVAAAQDASLPSPSLSPITAALQHGRSGGAFGTPSEGEDVEMSFELAPSRHHQRDNGGVSLPDASFFDEIDNRKLVIRKPDEAGFPNQQLPTPTLMEIPSMLDSFDAMPTEMQTYLMYQFLRRCSKPTLQLVAEVVNPALKCDFLSLLPLELSLAVIRYLDFQSLCRAAQVSRQWRHIINSDESAWKSLFDKDGYVLAEGELERGVREGWGWQDPYGGEDFEKDISCAGSSKSDGESSVLSGTSSGTNATRIADATSTFSTPTAGRPKRKAAGRFSKRKQPRIKEATRANREGDQSETWLKQLSKAEGPYAAASAAALAVPNPSIGLPSLRNLHFFKSMYRRHHTIRRSWMQDMAKPRHIAFRAHQRHVVTCLQFDTDKILTGSDDTNINVYDTKTGALRTRLEGHEGGVWALQYEGNVLVSGSTDRSVRVWDIERGICTQVFQGHTSTVRCLQILMPTEVGQTADGRPIMIPKQPLIITGSRDSNLRVWKLPQPGDREYFQAGLALNDTDNPFFVRTLTGHHHSVRAIAAHADTLVSGSYDCSVRVWKISTGETVHRLQGHTQKVYSVVLDHKRNRCISGSMDSMVKIWSLETGEALYKLEGHTSLVGLLDLSHDRLVSAAADSTLRIWDPENGQCKSTLSAHTAAITCFQHDGQKVISGSDQTLKMWNVKTGECVRNLLTDLSGVWQVKFNERRCVAAVQRNNLTYIEVLDFGAARDGMQEEKRGRRIVVNAKGHEISDPVEANVDDNQAQE